MASSPLTGGTWCLSSRNHRFYRKITKNESRRTINDKPTVLLFMQKDDIMLFLTAVSDFGEKLVGYQISFPGHQISMFWVCGFPTTQRVSVWRPGNSDYYTSRGSVTFFLCSGCHYSTISLHTNQLLCVCVCCVFTCSSSLSSSSLLFLWRKTALDSSLSFCSNTSSSAGSCRASSSLSSSSTELLLLLHTFIIDYTPVITQSTS